MFIKLYFQSEIIYNDELNELKVILLILKVF